MLTCICMQNVIKICHVVQELWVFSLTANRRTDSHSDYSADPRVIQFQIVGSVRVYCWSVQPDHTHIARGRLDLAVLFTPSTPNRQNRNQVHWNICAGVRWSTPSSEVVQTEQSRDLFQKRWRIIACMRGNILYRLIYSGVLRSAQFYLFMWLFWRTPSTLKIAKSSPPQIYMMVVS